MHVWYRIYIGVFVFIQEKSKRYPRGWLHTEGRARAFVHYGKVGGKCMLFLLLHCTHVMKGLRKKGTAAPSSHKFPHLHGGELITSKDGVSKNQPLWCERGACVWSPPALETTGPVKCTTAQLHISFDCQFVLRIARSFELRLQMKANLVHSVAAVDRCCCLFASGTIKGFGTIFFFLFFYSYSSVPRCIEHYV